MDIIRSKGRNTGGLPNVEETESEADAKSESEDYEDESTQEEFSRPPSRDGVDMRKLREPKEPNPRVLSHLKKFQEQDDLELSVNLPAEGILADHRKRKLGNQSFDDDNDFLNTHISSKSFSTRSIPTGSSHSSHAKGVLPSGLVSHLIPEQVNGFTYDRYKKQWVREKPRQSPEKPKGDDSEDDPFQDIPDLSVDELQEMMRIQASLSGEGTSDAGFSDDAAPSSPINTGPGQERPRQQTKDGDQSGIFSSLQSKVTRFTSSFPNSGTGATSIDSTGGRSRDASSEVSHEIHLQEGRISKPPSLQKERNKQARVVTISFSSPLVSQVAYSDNESPAKLHKIGNGQDAETDEGANGKESGPSLNNTSEQPFLKRSMSRIDETSEEAAENLSLVRRNPENTWSTPGKEGPDGSLAFLRNDQDTSYNSFHLSPLPDFTVDQIDQPLQLEVSYVAQRTHPSSLRQVHGTFALATEELVKHITEAEPFEPYWEHVRRLVLRRKGLITLHKLSDFCPRLEYLDVSFNEIGQLSGAPSTLRTLKIQDNFLSNLTSWGHLVNLQYLNVSGNELESLDGFSGLIHLRELNARNNKIRDVDGVFGLDGLLSLKLGNNNLTAVDFEGAELTRLQELDLSHNQLMSIRSIESLSALTTLDLSSNHLSTVDLASPLSNLRSLKLSNNQFYNLDVGVFPSLTLLYVDQNYLSTVSGLNQCRNLEILSAREQTMSAENNNGFFDIDLGLVKDVRKVYLSSNRLSLQSLSPSTPLLSLQLLDAASCNIQALPADFALNFPNVKVLNLNFNSLTGINELVGMNCLSRLTAAGNCISRMRRLCQVLSVIGRTNKNKICSLHKVDVRGNPLTVRFYPPAVTGNGRTGGAKQLSTRTEKPAVQEGGGLDIPSALAEFQHEDHDLNRPIFEGEEPDVDDEHETEINDPYTLPPADIQADLKYLAHLDRPTRLRRSIFELMLYAGTGGSVKVLDGLDLRPALEEGSDMDRAWVKLEKLGVLKRKAITS
jgi:Leucine-rich repeat (LRR) protein